MAEAITIGIVAAVVGGTTAAYSAKEERKAANKANDEAKQIAAEQNRLAKQREDIEAKRSNVAALRARNTALARAQLYGVATGQLSATGATSSSLMGATAAYGSQFAANQAFTSQVNQLNQATLELQTRQADSQSRLNKSLSSARAVGSMGQTIASGLTAYNQQLSPKDTSIKPLKSQSGEVIYGD